MTDRWDDRGEEERDRRGPRTDGRTADADGLFSLTIKAVMGLSGNRARSSREGRGGLPLRPTSLSRPMLKRLSLLQYGWRGVLAQPIRNLTLLCHPDAMHAAHGTERQENM